MATVAESIWLWLTHWGWCPVDRGQLSIVTIGGNSYVKCGSCEYARRL